MSDNAPTNRTLYRVYRPTTFEGDEFVGQEHVIHTLRNAIRHNRIAHAYLFCGPRGTGKTSTARLLAKAANCLNPDPDRRPCNECDACVAINTGRTMDIIEIDAASNRGIDEIRQLRETVQTTPAQLRFRFYIIDECHQLTPAAWNAFLKTLEEPPPHAKFILCTTEPEKLLDTVASRCQKFTFHRFSVPEMAGQMRRICAREGMAATDDALAAIARQATGSMRDALSLLDTLAAYGTAGAGITLETVRNVLGAGSNERVLAIVDALIANDVGAGIGAINAAMEAGVEPGVLAGQIVAALRALLYAAYAVPGLAEMTDAALAERVGAMPPAEVAYLTKLFSSVEFRLKHTAYGQLPLELAVVDAMLMRTSQFPAAPALGVRTEQAMSAPPPVAAAEGGRPLRPVATRPASPPPPAVADAPTPLRSERVRPERPAAPPADGSVSTNGAAGGLSLELLDGHWNRIKQAVKMEGRAKTVAILNDVTPHDVRGNLVVLMTTGAFHHKHINEDETRLLLERVIGQVTGQPVRVMGELMDSRSGAAPARGGRAPVRADEPPQMAAPRTSDEPQPPAAPAPPPPTPINAEAASGRMDAPARSAPTPDEEEIAIARLAKLYEAHPISGDETTRK